MLAQLARYCLFGAVLSPVIVAPSLELSFGKYVAFRLCVEFAAALVILDWAIRSPAGLRRRAAMAARSPVILAFAGFTAICLLSSAFAFDPAAAFWSTYGRGEGSFQTLHYLAFLFLLVLLFREPRDWERLFSVSLAGACFSVAYGLLWAAGMPASLVPQDPPIPDLSGFWGRLTNHRFIGSIGNPIWAGSYYLFQLGFLVWILSTRCSLAQILGAISGGWLGGICAYAGVFAAARQKPLGALSAFAATAVCCLAPLRFVPAESRRILAVAIPGIAFFCIGFLLAGSRGAALGLIAAVLTAAAILLPARKRWWLAAAGVAAILLAAALISSPSLRPASLRHLQALDLTSGDYRLQYWRTAWTAFLERPLVGWGPENFTAIHDRYGRVLWWVDHAHSIFFDTLAATGILGVAALSAVFAACALTLRRWTRRETPLAPGRRLQVAVLSALLALYLAQGLFSFDWLPVSLNLYLTMACLVSVAPQPAMEKAARAPAARSHLRYIASAAAVLAISWTAYAGNYRPLVKDAAFKQALTTRLETWDQTREAFNRSLLAPSPFGQHELLYEFGYTVAKLLEENKKDPAEVLLWVTYFRNLADPLIARGDVATVRLLEAAAALETAAFESSRNPEYLSAAYSYQTRGLAISPSNLTLLRNRFHLLNAAGRTAEARRSAVAVQALWPSLLPPDPAVLAALGNQP